MGYSNINATPNYQLQGFGQSGMRTISTSQAYVEGEYYRVLVATQDSTISATSVIGDDITGLQVYAGTTIYGLFTAVSVSVGEVTAYLAGATDIDSVWSYINTYGLNNGATIEAADCAKDAIEPLLDKYYAQASLVLVPSLYKTSIVYAERPLNTNGQLTFTRASDATRVGPDGYVEKVRTNLVPNGLLFIASTGVLYTTITSDTPISGVSSTRITKNEAAGTLRYANQNCSASALTGSISYTISRYFKYDGYNLTTSMEFNNSAQWGGVSWIQNIDIASTGITLQSPSNCTSKITNVGNGWYRVDVTIATGASPAGSPVTYLLKVGSTLATDQGFLTAAPQFETGDIATNYIPTTTAAVSVGPVSNLPRLNYPINADGSVGCPSLLLEPQRTNDIINNTALNNYTATRATWGANVAISPTGDQDAEKLIEDTTASNTHFFGIGGSYVSGTAYTWSIYVKSDGRDEVLIQAGNQAVLPLNCVFNLSTQTVSNFGSGTGAIIDAGNGWYRLVVRSLTALSTSSTNYILFLRNGGTVNYTGDGTSGVLVWGAQREIGAYETSLIPTLAASVTRVADACSKTGISSLIGQTEGTLYWEGKYDYRNISGYRLLFSINDGTWNNSGSLFIDNAAAQNQFAFYVRNSGSTTASILSSNLTDSDVGKTYKVAAAYKQNDFVLYINGVQIGTDTSGSVFASASRIDLGSIGFTGLSTSDLSSASQALLFKTRLTNAQLSELTSL